MNNMHGFAKICMLIIGMVFFNGIALDYSVSGVDSCVKGLKTNHLWLEMVNVHKKPSARDLDGNQILHLRSKNKNPITADRSGKTASYILQHLKEAAVFYSDADILKFAVEKAASLKGEYFEFGVGVGKTTNFIAALIPFKTLHGFDSFCGLPETWFSTCPQGEIGFKIQGAMPPLHANVLVHVGLFENVLPLFKKQYLKSQPVAFIHIDCDLYS